MAKAQVGDLIRITGEFDAGLTVGDIAEVSDSDATDFGVFVSCGRYVRHVNYEIHRKAGEEDSSPSYGGCSTCSAIIDKICPFCTDDNQSHDAVVKPSHYTNGRFETIEVIEEITGGYDDGFTAYNIGNVLKYVARAPHKHETPIECLSKAARYLDYAIAHEQRKIDGK